MLHLPSLQEMVYAPSQYAPMAPQYQAAQPQYAQATVPPQQAIMQQQPVMMQQPQMVAAPNYMSNMAPQQQQQYMQQQQQQQQEAPTQVQVAQPETTADGIARHAAMKAKIMSEMSKVQDLQSKLLLIETQHKEAKKAKTAVPDPAPPSKEKDAVEFVHTQDWWKKLAKSEKSPDARFRMLLRQIGSTSGNEKQELYRRMLRMWRATRESSKHLTWRLSHAREALARLKAQQAPLVTESNLKVRPCQTA